MLAGHVQSHALGITKVPHIGVWNEPRRAVHILTVLDFFYPIPDCSLPLTSSRTPYILTKMSHPNTSLPTRSFAQQSAPSSTTQAPAPGTLTFGGSLSGRVFGVMKIDNVVQYSGGLPPVAPWGTSGFFAPSARETAEALGTAISDCANAWINGLELDPSAHFNSLLRLSHTPDSQYRSVVPNRPDGRDRDDQLRFGPPEDSVGRQDSADDKRICYRIAREEWGKGATVVLMADQATETDRGSFLETLKKHPRLQGATVEEDLIGTEVLAGVARPSRSNQTLGSMAKSHAEKERYQFRHLTAGQ